METKKKIVEQMFFRRPPCISYAYASHFKKTSHLSVASAKVCVTSVAQRREWSISHIDTHILTSALYDSRTIDDCLSTHSRQPVMWLLSSIDLLCTQCYI